MSWAKRKIKGLKKNLKFSASNPKNFEEVWSFQSTPLRLLSLIILLFILLSTLVVFLFVFGPFSGYLSNNDVSIERKQLEDQNKEILRLTEKVENQEAYLSNMSRIVEGESPDQIVSDTMVEMPEIDYNSLNDEMTDHEKALSKEVKSDLSSNSDGFKKRNIIIFSNPITGEISQHFDQANHPGTDIVTHKGKEVKACLAGTVIYSGYTIQDGFMLIIDHGNNYLSMYKHNSTLFKQLGDNVQLGDPIAIVGNSGENSTGPHLHFELWHNRKPVNPEDYISFKN